MQACVICGPIERFLVPMPIPVDSTALLHDLNLPYEDTEEYETHTAELLFPPQSSSQMHQSPPLSVDVNVGIAYERRGKVERGTPNKPPMQDDFMMSFGKRKRENSASQVHKGGYTRQQDVDVTLEDFLVEDDFMMSPGKRKHGVSASQYHTCGYRLHQDGNATSEDFQEEDFFMMSPGKRKHDDSASQYLTWGYRSQQDGNATSEDFQVEKQKGN